jgi:hypothetical protein
MRKVGDRVGAIQKGDEKEVHLFGYGVYEGDQICPDLGFPNPKILLDSGLVVWGFECWWGSEEKIKKMIGNKKIIIVEPPAPGAGK